MPMNDPSDIGQNPHPDQRDAAMPTRVASLSEPDQDTVDELFKDGFDADAKRGGGAREAALRPLRATPEAHPTAPSSDALGASTSDAIAPVARGVTGGSLCSQDGTSAV